MEPSLKTLFHILFKSVEIVFHRAVKRLEKRLALFPGIYTLLKKCGESPIEDFDDLLEDGRSLRHIRQWLCAPGNGAGFLCRNCGADVIPGAADGSGTGAATFVGGRLPLRKPQSALAKRSHRSVDAFHFNIIVVIRTEAEGPLQGI